MTKHHALCVYTHPETKSQGEILITGHMLTFLFKLTKDRIHAGLAEWFDN